MDEKIKQMDDAMAMANYFIDRAAKDNVPLTLLKLLKLVYLAHGFSLAAFNKSFLSRYDRVEAWKFGPVIPSVYHSFKHNGSTPIKERGIIVLDFEKDGEADVVCPMPKDDVLPVLDFVWKRYGKRPASELVDLLHMRGTPWAEYYRAHQNAVIPDEATQEFYTMMLNALAKAGREARAQAKHDQIQA